MNKKIFFGISIPVLITLGISYQIYLTKKAKREYDRFNKSEIKGILDTRPRGESGATYFKVNETEYMINPDPTLTGSAETGDSIIKKSSEDIFVIAHNGQRTNYRVIKFQ